MKILVDAFGGDNAPLEIIKGCADAVKFDSAEIILVGDEKKIKDCAAENGIDISAMEILHAPGVITMEDDPRMVVKGKTDSSMSVGLVALSEGRGDAFVSAGSTGALVIGGTLIVKRIKGVRRAVIASVMPSMSDPFMLIDGGANLDFTPVDFVTVGTMGSLYMEKVMGIKTPRVGLANIGVEELKGTQLYRDAHVLMKEQTDFNFIGNVEARDIPFGVADVVVADGFTGNIILKMYEGVAAALMKNIKGIFMKNTLTKLAAVLVRGGITEFKDKMDYKQYGGAPLLGLRKPVIKAHGSSNAQAMRNAIKKATEFAQSGMIDNLTELYAASREDENVGD